MNSPKLGEVKLEHGLPTPVHDPEALADIEEPVQGLHPEGDQRQDGRGPVDEELARLAHEYGHD